MTGLANEAIVTPSQGEVRFLKMIKPEICPIRGDMAVDTFGAIAPLVYVVNAMAFDAGHWRVFINLIVVAIGADQVGMFAGQLEVSFGVVIELDIGPAHFVVAVRTLFAQVAPMGLIILVAGCAGIRGFTE
jgi:hypothetical protein